MKNSNFCSISHRTLPRAFHFHCSWIVLLKNEYFSRRLIFFCLVCLMLNMLNMLNIIKQNVLVTMGIHCFSPTTTSPGCLLKCQTQMNMQHLLTLWMHVCFHQCTHCLFSTRSKVTLRFSVITKEMHSCTPKW